MAEGVECPVYTKKAPLLDIFHFIRKLTAVHCLTTVAGQTEVSIQPGPLWKVRRVTRVHLPHW